MRLNFKEKEEVKVSFDGQSFVITNDSGILFECEDVTGMLRFLEARFSPEEENGN